MNKTRSAQILSLILCMVLIAAVALFAFGCDDKASDGIEKQFTLTVVDADGHDTTYDITSTYIHLGDALQEEGLIEGEEGPYGFYIKRVTGILADYDVNGAYWRLVVNGAESLLGISSVKINTGDRYRLEYTK